MVMSSSATKLLMALPLELIEAVLICSCSPRTVASIAQTCKTLHSLVYASPDSHLWRELFLAIWDDPRPALEHRALVDPRTDLTNWDWGVQYRRRVSADRWLKAWRRNIFLAVDCAETGTDAEWYSTAKVILSTLSAILDTLLTLRPFPASPPIALTEPTPATVTTISSFPTGNVESGVHDRRERMMSAPPFPPLLIVLASGVPTFKASRSGMRLGRMVYGPHASASRVLDSGRGMDATELVPIATPSLPPQLVRTLLASHAVGVRGLQAYVPHLSATDHWEGDALGDVFHRIICITGFVPTPAPLSDTAAPTLLENRRAIKESEGEEQHLEKDDSQPRPRVLKAFPTPSEQHGDARTLARRRVYDMRYLRGDRLWGPFQIVTRGSLDAVGLDNGKNRPRKGGKRAKTNRASSGVSHLGTLAWAMGVDVKSSEIDSTSSEDSDDEDWHDPSYSSQRPSSVERGQTDDVERTPNAQTDGPRNPTVARHSDPRVSSNSLASPREIRSQHLRPDYTYLASVRIVVEANLWELFGAQIGCGVEEAAFQARPGGVGMFWEDEDEILRARAHEYSEPARPTSTALPLSAYDSSFLTSSSVPTSDTGPGTLELADILARFRNFEVARLGSASGYWSGWTSSQKQSVNQSEASTDVSATSSSSEGNIGVRKPRIVMEKIQLETPREDNSTIGKGKGKEREIKPVFGTRPGDWEIGLEGEACDGWDWAGVSGIWRRCVCWMDYRELLFFNLDYSKFLTLETQEACRVIPMEVRITGYTRAGLMPVYDTDERDNINILTNRRPKTGIRTGYFRPPPVIHYSGSSVGSDRGINDGRRVKGTVQLIGGGEVRWQMDTYTQDSGSSTPEWSSEGVQVGGIGSAIGILGMWTGAGHERADPLGPFWAWKVA